MMYEEVRNDVAAFVLADKNGDGLDEKEFFQCVPLVMVLRRLFPALC